MKEKFFCILIFFLSSLSFVNGATEVWTLYAPDPSNQCRGSSIGKGFEVKGDFDGNGKPDLARLQENKKSHQRRVAVWLNGSPNPTVLVEDNEARAGDFLILEKPRQIKAFDGVSEFQYKVNLSSIGYGTCESSNKIFQWNPKEKQFVGTWVSD